MSQKSEILAYLKTGKSLTQEQARDMFGCWRLSAVIHRLRKRYRIKTELNKWATYTLEGQYVNIGDTVYAGGETWEVKEVDDDGTCLVSCGDREQWISLPEL